MILCMKVINRTEVVEECLHQLIREIVIQSYVSHPNIVNLYGFSSDINSIYLLLEPCLEGNLYEKIKRGPLP
jgi:serine/threonine protein kinase